MNKKLYLIRSSTTKFGGAENYLFRLSNALKREKIDHQIINSYLPKFLPSWIRALLFNIQLIFIKKTKFFYSLDRITCADLYRAGDGVHKAFLTIENKSKFNLLHPTYLFLEKKCFINSKSIIANSKMVKEEIIKYYKINPNKIHVIYNGIEAKKINYQKSFNRLSKEFLISKKQPIFLFVGSGFKRKGVDEFLQIIAMLESKDIKAFIVGKEKNINYYKNLATKLKIDKQVFFTGPRIDVDDFYSISDILLFPTHYDPFSNVVLEAMSFKNVVFTTRNNGACEILNDSFIMEKPFDTKVISTINKLISDKTKLDIEQNKNREISKDFSVEKNLLKTLEVIKQIDY